MLKKLPFYPILCAVFSILSLAAHNVEEISLVVLLRPLAAATILSILLFWLAQRFLREWHRAALATLAITFFFFVYGHVYNLLEDLTIANISVFRHRTLLPLFGILLLVQLYLIARHLDQPVKYTLLFNTLSILLLLYPTSKIGFSVLQHLSTDRAVQVAHKDLAPAGRQQPDIYYIILDAYGREDIFRGFLRYDNHDFVTALRQRGFYVADCSQSNYAYTDFSLTSALNYEYLDTLSVSHSRADRVALLKHGSVRTFLEANGYKTIAFPTGWPFTEWKDADLYLDFDRPLTSLSEFETLILNTTLLRALNDSVSTGTLQATHKDLRRLRVLSLLDKIKQLPNMDGDLFVFAHIVVPHLPYTFGPNGEVPVYDGKTATYEQTRNAYIGQVEFINSEILKVVDALMENSETPPVIIIQGDHGPLPDIAEGYPERMAILNAYYFPGMQLDEILYPSISPVNTFRVVLNTYFGQELPLLEDRSYFAPEKDRSAVQLVPNTYSCEP